MGKFEESEPLCEAGNIVERPRILQFFIGTVLLTALILLFTAISLTLFTNLSFPVNPYSAVIVVSPFVGIAGTLLAIRHELEEVFVPYLRVTPEDGRTVLRSPEMIDSENYEYHIILPVNDEYILRYRGFGPSHEEIQVKGVRQQEATQVDYDKGRFADITRAVYIGSISLH